MYIQRLAESLVQKSFFFFEIFSFEVDAYMCVQKTFLALLPTALKNILRCSLQRLNFFFVKVHFLSAVGYNA